MTPLSLSFSLAPSLFLPFRPSRVLDVSINDMLAPGCTKPISPFAIRLADSLPYWLSLYLSQVLLYQCLVAVPQKLPVLGP